MIFLVTTLGTCKLNTSINIWSSLPFSFFFSFDDHHDPSLLPPYSVYSYSCFSLSFHFVFHPTHAFYTLFDSKSFFNERTPLSHQLVKSAVFWLTQHFTKPEGHNFPLSKPHPEKRDEGRWLYREASVFTGWFTFFSM